MDKLGLKLLELLRGGADPRRADLGRLRRADEVSAQTHARALTEVGTRNLRNGLTLGAAMGVLGSLLVLVVLCVAAGLRPASVGDIAMARRLRAVLPDPERLSQADFARRLAVPLEVGRLVTPLVASEPSPLSGYAQTLAAFGEQIGVSVEPNRLDALGQLASRLGRLPPQARSEQLDTILALDRALRDPAATMILRAIADMPTGDLKTLSGVKDLQLLLSEIAGLPPAKQAILRQGGIAAVLPDDGERADLLRMFPTLDPPAVHLLVRWTNATAAQRQLLIYLLDQIEASNSAFVKLATAFYVGNPVIGQALRALRPSCGYANTEACR